MGVESGFKLTVMEKYGLRKHRRCLIGDGICPNNQTFENVSMLNLYNEASYIMNRDFRIAFLGLRKNGIDSEAMHLNTSVNTVEQKDEKFVIEVREIATIHGTCYILDVHKNVGLMETMRFLYQTDDEKLNKNDTYFDLRLILFHGNEWQGLVNFAWTQYKPLILTVEKSRPSVQIQLDQEVHNFDVTGINPKKISICNFESICFREQKL